jgi:two-component system, response regulator PdtaR
MIHDPLSAIRPARLLIVEDEYFVALNAQQALENAGFIVTGIASNAAHALKLAEQDNPEIVLMDVRLNGARDGVDAAIILRSAMNLPCIFVTAHTEKPVRARAEPARPLGWLQKPYSERALIETVNKALASLAD